MDHAEDHILFKIMYCWPKLTLLATLFYTREFEIVSLQKIRLKFVSFNINVVLFIVIINELNPNDLIC